MNVVSLPWKDVNHRVNSVLLIPVCKWNDLDTKSEKCPVKKPIQQKHLTWEERKLSETVHSKITFSLIKPHFPVKSFRFKECWRLLFEDTRLGTQQFKVYKFPEKGRGRVRLWAGHRPSLSRFMAVRPSQQTSKYIGQIRRRLEHFCSIRGHKGDLSTNKSPYAPTVLRSGPLSNTDRKLNPLKSLWWHRGENRDLMKSLPSSRVGNIS